MARSKSMTVSGALMAVTTDPYSYEKNGEVKSGKGLKFWLDHGFNRAPEDIDVQDNDQSLWDTLAGSAPGTPIEVECELRAFGGEIRTTVKRLVKVGAAK